MTFRTLIRRSLRFHWRAHLGVVLGAAIGSAALIGALVVGDSVKASLRERALERLGWVDAAMDLRDRLIPNDYFSETFVRSYTNAASHVVNIQQSAAFAVLRSSGTISRTDGAGRANQVSVIGIRPFNLLDPFYSSPGNVTVNATLAQQLHLQAGDEIILRLRKPSALSSEAVVSPRTDATVSLRLKVHSIVAGDDLGDLSLQQSQSPPLNAFVNRDELNQALGLNDKVNLLLGGAFQYQHTPKFATWSSGIGSLGKYALSLLNRMGIGLTRAVSIPEPETAARLNSEIPKRMVFEAAGLSFALPTQTSIELRTSRVFLDPPVARSVLSADSNAQPILTYLVNLLRAGTNTTPYSMVTAAGAPWTLADMRDDEILVSQWLAEDLRVKPGDEMTLVYFDPESGSRLVEHTNVFHVRAIVPMEMPWADRTLMPDFPGIEKAESTSDWDAGFPLVHKIREKDEEYWKQHRGTPKAFITLAAGQKMWANRFGDLTAIRFPIPTNAPPLTPALSPGERENHSQAQNKTETGKSSTHSEQYRTGQMLSPLPAGEGQGEGGRQPNSVGTPSTASQTVRTDGDAVERVPTSVDAYRAALEKKILANLKPEELGLRFEPVREQALKAAEHSQDFGGLFLGFSFFLIVAALLLMAMLFQFGLEQRMAEIGTLLALGFTPRQVRRLLLGEGVALAFIGGVLGAFGGLAYARAMLHGLATIWRDAVGASTLSFHTTSQTLAIGLFAATAVGAITIWLALRKFVRRSARELLAGEVQNPETRVRSRGRLIGSVALAGALGLVGFTLARGDTANAGVFFGAGALVLIAGLATVNAKLVRLAGSNVLTLTPALSLREREHHTQASSVVQTGEHSNTLEHSEAGRPLSPLPAGEGKGEGERREVLSLSALGLRGCARRRTRSLATIAMLACGSFLIVSIGVFRLDASRDASKRSSGTGGFALIGETTMPVVHDLNSVSGRDFFALSERDLEGVSFVPFRVREGDEASCLNLNRAQKPRLLGVRPELLDGRFSFAKGEDWRTLPAGGGQASRLSPSKMDNEKSETGATPVLRDEIPAIGDANSIQWSMGKKVGETIDFVDERGQPFKVRIVGAVANSILQGQLLVDEAEFVKRFPGESGYRMFLIDVPSNRVAEVSATLSRAMQDVGLELTPTAQRLAQFNAVQNTYLGTFQVLGGLGLLLGSVGLGIVVLRNVLERRGELAVLLAVGFRKPTLQRLLLMENGALLALGLALGIVAAGVAVLPAVLSPAAQLPYASLALTLGAVLVNGALWTWAATRFALRGDLLAALRNE